MADYTFNIAKGRPAAFYERVKSNDPANSALVLIPLSAQGSEAEAQDYDTVSAVLGGASDERTSGGWARAILTDSELAAFPAPNDTANRMDLAVPVHSFGFIPTGNDVVALLIAYDPDTTGGTDTNLVPICSNTFAITTNGNEVVLNATDFMHSS